jgi:predicted CopG family antitoxin
MNKNIKKSLKGGSLNSINSMSQSLKTNDPISDATNMGFQKANEIIPFSDAQKEVSNNINKANTFVSDATSQINSLASDANNSVSQAQNAANSLGTAASNAQLQESPGITDEIKYVIKDGANFAGEIGSLAATVELQQGAILADTAVNAASEAAERVGKTLKTNSPQIMDAIQTTSELFFNGQNVYEKIKDEAKAKADVISTQINADAKSSQIEILMRSGITKEEAEAEFKKIEEKREEDEKADRDAELKMEEAAAAAATALELAKATSNKEGGSRKKMMTLSQIQKGGRQSANRTKKSINDFFNSSVTSSQILKRFAKPDNKRKTIRKSKRRKHGGRRSRKQKI